LGDALLTSWRGRNRLLKTPIENRGPSDGSFRLNVATEEMNELRRARAMVNASCREQRIWLGVAASTAICAVVSGALILYWGHRGPRSDCDVFGDMTLQWNSDVAPAKTALSTDPSQRDAVLIVAGAEESFSYALRASTRDLSSRSIQSALNRWADGLYRGTGRSVGVSPSASYATAPISHACPRVGTVCGTDKSSADVQLAWPKGVDAQQQWVQHRSSNRPEKTDIHDIDSRVSNIIMYAI
jgi:hypothetical protein